MLSMVSAQLTQPNRNQTDAKPAQLLRTHQNRPENPNTAKLSNPAKLEGRDAVIVFAQLRIHAPHIVFTDHLFNRYWIYPIPDAADSNIQDICERGNSMGSVSRSSVSQSGRRCCAADT